MANRVSWDFRWSHTGSNRRYIHNGILPSQKKEIIWVRVAWMNLETVIQNEVSQKEKNKYILMHIHIILKTGIDEPVCKAGIETQTQIMDLRTQWGEGESGMNWENSRGNPLHYSCLENPRGQRSLVGYSPWGRKEPDMTERLSTHTHKLIHKHTHTHTHINTHYHM